MTRKRSFVHPSLCLSVNHTAQEMTVAGHYSFVWHLHYTFTQCHLQWQVILTSLLCDVIHWPAISIATTNNCSTVTHQPTHLWPDIRRLSTAASSIEAETSSTARWIISDQWAKCFSGTPITSATNNIGLQTHHHMRLWHLHNKLQTTENNLLVTYYKYFHFLAFV